MNYLTIRFLLIKFIVFCILFLICNLMFIFNKNRKTEIEKIENWKLKKKKSYILEFILTNY